MEVTARCLDSAKSAGFFVVIEAELATEACDDSRGPDLECVLIDVAQVGDVAKRDFGESSGFIVVKTLEYFTTRNVLQMAEPIVGLLQGDKGLLLRLPDDRPRLTVVPVVNLIKKIRHLKLQKC